MSGEDEHVPLLVEWLGGYCDWMKLDRDGYGYPCSKPSYRRMVNAPELWGGDYCRHHAPRALKRATAEVKADAEEFEPLAASEDE